MFLGYLSFELLQETQERTRKRIKEDLKNATSAHLDYADNILPRFKRNYVKKCQEVEVGNLLLCTLHILISGPGS